MARERNLHNSKTEKEGIQILRKIIPNSLVPIKEERIFTYKKLGIDYKKHSRSVDGIILNAKSFQILIPKMILI